VSDTVTSDPRVRVTQSNWYLYHSGDSSLYGPDGFVRAVIEEVCDEVVEGDGGLKHARRRVFVSATEIRDTNRDQWDQVDEALEAMSNADFHALVDQGTLIPFPLNR
jgi:hypothetical protein